MDSVHYCCQVLDVVPRVREFNRLWTQVLGLLDQRLLNTKHSLPEARVIFELAQHDAWERSDLRERLAIDDSFLTRLLHGLERQDLATTQRSPLDGRRRRVMLTDTGRKAFAELDQRSGEQVKHLIGTLTAAQRRSLVEAMTTISCLIHPSPDRTASIRGLGPGDLGWVIQRHGEIYSEEFGWDQSFEGLVAKIVADYDANLRPGRENAWIADVDGVRAGCVFCCERDTDTAQLRILLVEPWARGMGLGGRLVGECVEFARRARYGSIMLWTNDVLGSARRIYEAAGFRLVEEEQHHSFGHDLVGQNWTLDL